MHAIGLKLKLERSFFPVHLLHLSWEKQIRVETIFSSGQFIEMAMSNRIAIIKICKTVLLIIRRIRLFQPVKWHNVPSKYGQHFPMRFARIPVWHRFDRNMNAFTVSKRDIYILNWKAGLRLLFPCLLSSCTNAPIYWICGFWVLMLIWIQDVLLFSGNLWIICYCQCASMQNYVSHTYRWV